MLEDCNDVIISTMASQITSLTIVYSTIYSRCRSKKTPKLRVTGLCGRWPVNSPHKGPVTWKMFPFDDVIMPSRIVSPHCCYCIASCAYNDMHGIFRAGFIDFVWCSKLYINRLSKLSINQPTIICLVRKSINRHHSTRNINGCTPMAILSILYIKHGLSCSWSMNIQYTWGTADTAVVSVLLWLDAGQFDQYPWRLIH